MACFAQGKIFTARCAPSIPSNHTNGFALNTFVSVSDRLTVCIKVDSAFATRTNTSASRQCLSIQLSRSGETSMPGLKQNRVKVISRKLLEGEGVTPTIEPEKDFETEDQMRLHLDMKTHLSTKTTSSFKRLHLSFGQQSRMSVLGCNFMELTAFAICPID